MIEDTEIYVYEYETNEIASGEYNYIFLPIDSRGNTFSNRPLTSGPANLPPDELWPDVEDLIYDNQSWYWSAEWQEMEAEASEDLAEGRYKTFQTIDDMITFLDSEYE